MWIHFWFLEKYRSVQPELEQILRNFPRIVRIFLESWDFSREFSRKPLFFSRKETIIRGFPKIMGCYSISVHFWSRCWQQGFVWFFLRNPENSHDNSHANLFFSHDSHDFISDMQLICTWLSAICWNEWIDQSCASKTTCAYHWNNPSQWCVNEDLVNIHQSLWIWGCCHLTFTLMKGN